MYLQQLAQWRSRPRRPWQAPRRARQPAADQRRPAPHQENWNASCAAREGHWPRRQPCWCCQKVEAIFNKGGRPNDRPGRSPNLAQDIRPPAGRRPSAPPASGGHHRAHLQRWKARAGAAARRRPPAGRATNTRHALSVAERPDRAGRQRAALRRHAAGAHRAGRWPTKGLSRQRSSFQRVLRAHGQNAVAGAAPGAARQPGRRPRMSPRHRQVWCWDMTYLPAEVVGRWFICT